MENVIARFPTGKAVAYFVFCFTLIGFFFFATSYIAFSTDFLQTRGLIWLLFLVAGWLAGIVGLLALLALLKQIAFERSRAVWSDEKSIVYLNKYWISARKDQISNISLGTFGKFNSPAIMLHLHDGAKKFIPTAALSEDPHVIVTRLLQAISV